MIKNVLLKTNVVLLVAARNALLQFWLQHVSMQEPWPNTRPENLVSLQEELTSLDVILMEDLVLFSVMMACAGVSIKKDVKLKVEINLYIL